MLCTGRPWPADPGRLGVNAFQDGSGSKPGLCARPECRARSYQPTLVGTVRRAPCVIMTLCRRGCSRCRCRHGCVAGASRVSHTGVTRDIASVPSGFEVALARGKIGRFFGRSLTATSWWLRFEPSQGRARLLPIGTTTWHRKRALGRAADLGKTGVSRSRSIPYLWSCQRVVPATKISPEAPASQSPTSQEAWHHLGDCEVRGFAFSGLADGF